MKPRRAENGTRDRAFLRDVGGACINNRCSLRRRNCRMMLRDRSYTHPVMSEALNDLSGAV